MTSTRLFASAQAPTPESERQLSAEDRYRCADAGIGREGDGGDDPSQGTDLLSRYWCFTSAICISPRI